LFLFTSETSTDIHYTSVQIQAANGSVLRKSMKFMYFMSAMAFHFGKTSWGILLYAHCEYRKFTHFGMYSYIMSGYYIFLRETSLMHDY